MRGKIELESSRRFGFNQPTWHQSIIEEVIIVLFRRIATLDEPCESTVYLVLRMSRA
jgi:hypothetical protein